MLIQLYSNNQTVCLCDNYKFMEEKCNIHGLPMLKQINYCWHHYIVCYATVFDRIILDITLWSNTHTTAIYILRRNFSTLCDELTNIWITILIYIHLCLTQHTACLWSKLHFHYIHTCPCMYVHIPFKVCQHQSQSQSQFNAFY